VFELKRLTKAGFYFKILYAISDAPTTLGAIELENKYVLALFLRTSTAYFVEETNPPVAPPIDLPKVELIKSIFPSNPNN
jgi:hypothetical protein